MFKVDLKKVIAILSSTLLLSMSIFFMFFWSYKQSHREAREWQRGSYPLLCHLFVYCDPKLSKAQCSDTQKAVQHLNQQLPKPPGLKGGPQWLSFNGSLRRKTPDKIAVVRPPTKRMLQPMGMCDDRISVLGDLGILTMHKEKHRTRYDAFVCFNKIYRGEGLRGSFRTKFVSEMLQVGSVGFIAHELLHAFLGGVSMQRPYGLEDQPWIYAHPRTMPGLMALSPSTREVGHTTRLIFQYHIEKACSPR